MKRVIFTVLLTALVVLGIGALNDFIQNRPSVPEEFAAIRQESAAVASEMNAKIEASLLALKEIETLDRRFQYNQALQIVGDELQKTEERAKLAIQLSAQMESLAGLIPKIRPEIARQLALEAVSAQVAAATRLAAYNDTLGELFTALQLKFRGEPTNPARVSLLVETLNEHASEINKLNEKFKQTLDKFDALFA